MADTQLSQTVTMGDWKLIMVALKEKLAANMAVDVDTLDDDDAAELCEEMDKLEGLLSALKHAFIRDYGEINLPE